MDTLRSILCCRARVASIEDANLRLNEKNLLIIRIISGVAGLRGSSAKITESTWGGGVNAERETDSSVRMCKQL